VLLNNDLSAGIPALLKNLHDQWVIPPVHAGWHTRRKSNHAAAYDRVTRDFGAAIGIDPWRINPAFDTCSGLDFHARTGEQELADKVAAMLDGIRAKYKEYGISDEPFVVVKADAGTYGMGVMTVKDAAELIGLNRKQRNKMSVVKEGLEVTDHPGGRATPSRRSTTRWPSRWST
jgi:glutamate--cysteine ligase